MTSLSDHLSEHHDQLSACRLCPAMVGPVVAPPPVASKVLLLGQAPGPHEGRLGRPFAWTAGKTLFSWFVRFGLDEERFRAAIYMAAVCRCFPGKNPKGGDRVPSADEVDNCSRWLSREVQLLRPQLLLPVGKLAIAQVMTVHRLADVVGEVFSVELCGRRLDAIPLPHPSGASTWHRTQPGKELLARALDRVGEHSAFREAVASLGAP